MSVKMRGKILSNKRAVSPVITTILLVVMAIVLASIIFIWSRSFIKENISKTVGDESRPIDEACAGVKLDASSDGASISISNTGNIPIKQIGVRVSGKISTPAMDSLGPGGSVVLPLDSTSGEIILIPILLGTGEKDGVKEYYCPKSYWKSLA